MMNSVFKSGLPNFMFEKAEEISQIRRENLQKAMQMGVQVVMGTDAGTPYNYHGKNSMELVQYLEQDIMDEHQAIIASTSLAAKAIGVEKLTGSLEKDKFADLLVLNENPLHNIKALIDLNNIRLILKEGEIITGQVDTAQWTAQSPLEMHK
jgi:imidazolonepropionase-like amidohydrolase